LQIRQEAKSFAIAAAGGLGNRIQTGFRTQHRGQVDIHTRLDQRRRYQTTWQSVFQPLPDFAQHRAAMLGAHQRAQVTGTRLIGNGVEERAGMAAVVDDAQHLFALPQVAANGMQRAKRRAEMAIDAIQNKIEANDGLKKIQILESNIDEAGNTGQFKLTLTFSNNKQDTTTPIVTIHENGRWKLTESTLLLAAFGNDIGTPMKTMEDARLAGDIDRMIGQFSSRIRENMRANIRFMDREYLLRQFGMSRELREEYQAEGGFKAVEVMWLEFDEINNTAEVKVKYVYNNGDEEIGTTTMTMILESGEWKMGL